MYTELCGPRGPNEGDDQYFVNGYLPCEDGDFPPGGPGDAGDGCFNCQVEWGWECDGGDRLEWDTCWEICGDGHDFGTYECDDGNYNSGDGCNQLCKVEKGWNCTGGEVGTFGM